MISGDHSQVVVPCNARCVSSNPHAMDGVEYFRQKRLQQCGPPANLAGMLIRPMYQCSAQGNRGARVVAAIHENSNTHTIASRTGA